MLHQRRSAVSDNTGSGSHSRLSTRSSCSQASTSSRQSRGAPGHMVSRRMSVKRHLPCAVARRSSLSFPRQTDVMLPIGASEQVKRIERLREVYLSELNPDKIQPPEDVVAWSMMLDINDILRECG
jgi:hypothetical protein